MNKTIRRHYEQIKRENPELGALTAYRWARGRVQPTEPARIIEAAETVCSGDMAKWTFGRFELRAELEPDEDSSDSVDFFAKVQSERDPGAIPIDRDGESLAGRDLNKYQAWSDNRRVRWVCSDYGYEQFRKDRHERGMSKNDAHLEALKAAKKDAQTYIDYGSTWSSSVLVVTAHDKRTGIKLGSAYLGGIDTGLGDRADDVAHLAELLRDQEHEAIAEARTALEKLRHPRKAIA